MLNSKSIFISEVRKRLAKKRKLKMKNVQVIIDQIPVDKIKYHRQSLLLSYNDFKNNDKYIENFIKEKSYKSIYKRKSLLKRKVITNLLTKKYNNNIPKNLKQSNANSCSSIKKYYLNTPKKTPFQIGHIQIKYYKDYINNSQKKNLSNKLKEESKIQSFSINKYNEKKHVFGKHPMTKNKTITKINKIPKLEYNSIYPRKYCSVIKIRNHMNYFKNKDKKYLENNKSLKIFKPNCYFNKINLEKLSKKVSTNYNSI